MRDQIRRGDILIIIIILIGSAVFVADRNFYNRHFTSFENSKEISTNFNFEKKNYIYPKVIFYNRVGKCGSRNRYDS